MVGYMCIDDGIIHERAHLAALRDILYEYIAEQESWLIKAICG